MQKINFYQQILWDCMRLYEAVVAQMLRHKNEFQGLQVLSYQVYFFVSEFGNDGSIRQLP